MPGHCCKVTNIEILPESVSLTYLQTAESLTGCNSVGCLTAPTRLRTPGGCQSVSSLDRQITSDTLESAGRARRSPFVECDSPHSGVCLDTAFPDALEAVSSICTLVNEYAIQKPCTDLLG